MHRLNRVFPARLAAFEEVKGLIEDFGAMAGLSREDRHKLTLIVEELFTNTVTHGHRGDSDAPVSITFQEDADGLELTYEDSAPPFDPFAAGRRVDIDSTIRERRVGGLGIFITIGLAENAEYSCASGRNRIRLRLRLGAR